MSDTNGALDGRQAEVYRVPRSCDRTRISTMITVTNWDAESSVAAMASGLMMQPATVAIISHGALSVAHGTVVVVPPLPFGSVALGVGMDTPCLSWFSLGRACLSPKCSGVPRVLSGLVFLRDGTDK